MIVNLVLLRIDFDFLKVVGDGMCAVSLSSLNLIDGCFKIDFSIMG